VSRGEVGSVGEPNVMTLSFSPYSIRSTRSPRIPSPASRIVCYFSKLKASQLLHPIIARVRLRNDKKRSKPAQGKERMAEHSPTEIGSQHPTFSASVRDENFDAANPAREQAEPNMQSPRPNASSDAPPLKPATLVEVESLLNAFRMLVLRHFIRRDVAGSPVVSDTRPGIPGQEDPPFLPGVYLVLLTKSPKEIAENDVFLRQLCSSIKVLTDMAAPATVSSIYRRLRSCVTRQASSRRPRQSWRRGVCGAGL
jgi:hypothetical protein